MGLADWLRGLLRGRAGEADGSAFYVYLRCSACGEKIRLRIDRQSELSQDFERGGYFVRKVAVGQRCFRPIEVELRLDQAYREVSCQVTGGEALTREAFEADP